MFVFNGLYSTVPPSNLRVEILTRLLGVLPLDSLIVILACTFDLVLPDEVDKKKIKGEKSRGVGRDTENQSMGI